MIDFNRDAPDEPWPWLERFMHRLELSGIKPVNGSYHFANSWGTKAPLGFFVPERAIASLYERFPEEEWPKLPKGISGG